MSSPPPPILPRRTSSRNPRIFTHGNGKLVPVQVANPAVCFLPFQILGSHIALRQLETDRAVGSTPRSPYPSGALVAEGGLLSRYSFASLPKDSASSPARSIRAQSEEIDSHHLRGRMQSRTVRELTPINSADAAERVVLHLLHERERLPDEMRDNSEGEIQCMMLKRGSQVFLRLTAQELNTLSQATSRQFSKLLEPSRYNTPEAEPTTLVIASPTLETLGGNSALTVDERFPDRADPVPVRKTYKGTQRSYHVWKENGVPALGVEIRAHRIIPRLQLAQAGDLYEIYCGDPSYPTVWVMQQGRWSSIAVKDQNPVLGQYVLHYTPEGGPSWVLRETRAKYERNLARQNRAWLKESKRYECQIMGSIQNVAHGEQSTTTTRHTLRVSLNAFLVSTSDAEAPVQTLLGIGIGMSTAKVGKLERLRIS
ncbi:hypothetical protein SISSUDRAFT_1036952 [Sistotremastrum suecicum HHB10207 ss-3]|uniref:Uncharacterized protein n=1 Tax=Sistotremastrum suecicum HHB10207 ss-3 TaxID=1314776 RepID=A0A165YS94_9AGAM|nr:hypothetical protein SISSUDRAFT_1036952 [Sistotremastrum suecicum HHB10207 ss-3]